MTAVDGDRQWMLNAARGTIASGHAHAFVQALRLQPDLADHDPDLHAALVEGDLAHPNDPNRQWSGPAPWEHDIDIAPDTMALLEELHAAQEDEHNPFLNWPDLFSDEEVEEGWLYDAVFARGRGHAIYAQHKQGKSLFVLWVAAELATTRTDIDVVYLDYEMTRSDVRERLEDMGYGPDSDLTRLHYALLPSMPPLDTLEGAGTLLEMIKRVQRPDSHVLVIIDTTARAAEGKENDADTYRNFYRCTGILLKRHGHTWVRLDHAGKDPLKGQRGSSSKGDDVDVVWKLIAEEGGVKLHRDAARMSWVPEESAFIMATDPLRYTHGNPWPAGTKALADELDALGLPLDVPVRQAKKKAREAGIKARNDVYGAALKFRRLRLTEVPTEPEKTAGNTAGNASEAFPGNKTGNEPSTPPLTCREQNGERAGTSGGPSVGVPPPLWGEHPTGNPGTLPPLDLEELF